MAPNPELSFVLELVEPWEDWKICHECIRDELKSIEATLIAPIVVLVSDSKSTPEKSNILTVVCWGRRHSNDPTAGHGLRPAARALG